MVVQVVVQRAGEAVTLQLPSWMHYPRNGVEEAKVTNHELLLK